MPSRSEPPAAACDVDDPDAQGPVPELLMSSYELLDVPSAWEWAEISVPWHPVSRYGHGEMLPCGAIQVESAKK